MLETRRSVRKYNDKKVKKEDIQEIVKAGQLAPNGMNRQDNIFVVVQDKDVVSQLSKLNASVMGKDMDPFYGAKTMVIVFSNSQNPTYMEDGACAMCNMMNRAHELGIGSCWIHRAREVFSMDEAKAFRDKWDLPEYYVGIGNCVLGYDDVSKEKEITSKVVWD